MIWLAVLFSLPFVWLAARHRTLRRLAIRNTARRPVEAMLVVVGSLLGTAIVTGSLVLGDTLDRSIRAAAYDQLGPIDETVSVNGLAEGTELVKRLEGLSSPDIDGTLSFVTAGASVVNPAPDGGTQPRAQLVEVDFAAGRSFGSDPAITGLSGATPEPGRAVITTDLADKLHLTAGEPFSVFAYGTESVMTVDRVLPRRGVAGYWTIDGRQQSYNVLVAPGTIAALVDTTIGAATGEAVPPEVVVAVSNVGGVESGATRTATASTAIDEIVAPLGLRSVPVKETLLDLATTNAEGLSEFYFTIGMFAVIAGVMLLVNIFVMLADERRSELGMLRAIGMRRAPLVGAFALEGWFYALVSSALGAVVGIGVGRVITWRADAILSRGEETTQLNMEFAFTWPTVVTGFAIGFVIALATIVASSVRIARFNVIRAIRDVQEPPRLRPRWRVVVTGLTVAVAGLALAAVGFGASNGYGILAGPALVAAGVSPLLARRLPARAVATVAAAVVLVWGVVALPVLGSMDIAIEIPIFLVQGLVLCAAAIALVSVHQERIGRAVARLSGRSLSVRLGLAYPLARRFRTAMTMAMFAIVILTLIYMAVISRMLNSRTDELSSDLGGGFNIIATSSASNPISTDALRALPGVNTVAPVSQVFADFSSGVDPPMAWPVTGIGPELLAEPPQLKDLGSYPDNTTAWAAVQADPSLVIVDENFLITAGGPPTQTPKVGDNITITDARSGQSRTLTVAALAQGDLIGNGAFVSGTTLRDLFGARATPARFYLSADDPEATIQAIRAGFIANGADASTVANLVEGVLAQSSAFFTLMEQFVGVGLIVGIAGIGVIMIRAVRERRREVGVLRSLGFAARRVAAVMVFEATFIALQGIIIGITVALVASYFFSTADADWAEGVSWTIPTTSVALIVSVAVTATMITSLWPARRAAAIHPAAALRAAD